MYSYNVICAGFGTTDNPFCGETIPNRFVLAYVYGVPALIISVRSSDVIDESPICVIANSSSTVSLRRYGLPWYPSSILFSSNPIWSSKMNAPYSNGLFKSYFFSSILGDLAVCTPGPFGPFGYATYHSITLAFTYIIPSSVVELPVPEFAKNLSTI